LRTPYVYHYNLDIQREVANDMIVDVAYAGSSSHKLTGIYDGNPFVPGTTSRIFNLPSGNPATAFSYLDTFANVGNANYNSLQLALRGRPHELPGLGNLSYQFSYTYSKSEDTESGFRATNSRVPSFDRAHFKSVSDFDLTNYISISGVWGLPSPKNWGGAPRLLLSGWTLEPIVSHRSGLPLDVLARFTHPIPPPGPSPAGPGHLVQPNQLAP